MLAKTMLAMKRTTCVSKLQNALNASTRSGQITDNLKALSAAEIEFIEKDWLLWARDDQLPPISLDSADPWRVWLILGGRGAGKTRTGAEWLRAKIFGTWCKETPPARRIALIGETLIDARRVMVDGVSGLLAVHRAEERPQFDGSKNQLVWPNGAIAQLFSAEDADSLRGPQFDTAWCDELAKWRAPEAVWDMLQFALRLGAAPQVVVTTTPRPLPILQALIDDGATAVTRISTAKNAANLSPGFIAQIQKRYQGSALWRQEFLGEIVDDSASALWRRDWIESHRLDGAPDLVRVVVAVDPPVTATKTSDSCGIVVAGVGGDGRGYVLADRTLQGQAPQVWARAVMAAYRDFHADRVVAEVNQGGDLIETVLRTIDTNAPVTKVRATRGKWLRAEPIAALYSEGRIAHVGCFCALEDQMCAFRPDVGRGRGKSPDRVDALVWALTDLMLDQPSKPSIRKL